MVREPPTFDALPRAVARLEAQVEKILELLNTKVQNDAETRKYLGKDEALQYLNSNGYRISASTLYKLTGHNKIPHIKASGYLMFNLEELNHWLLKKLKQ